MQDRYLDASRLKQAFRGGSAELGANKAAVDALNVFPVPDGDTGTNMHLTITAAIREMEKIDTDSLDEILKALANGALMGARGNSGVILSQLLRGFSQVGAGKKKLDAELLALSLQKAVDVAYRSVIKPVEGTILTVAKAAALGAKAQAQAGGNCQEVLENAVASGLSALAKTPQLLPMLAEAGVVDAGGKGFIFILQGMLKSLSSEHFDFVELEPLQSRPGIKEDIPEKFLTSLLFKYCTELIIKGKNLSKQLIQQELQDLGDSLLVVGAENLIKIHIHTNDPGQVLSLAAQLGSMHDVKIDNMEEQHQERLLSREAIVQVEKPQKKLGVVAVTVGSGLEAVLKSLGVDVIISGGQTMNPSTEDLIAGIIQTGANQVLILPNNKNIILAAEQARDLAKKQGIEVAVVPSKNYPQSLAAMLVFNQDVELKENYEKMVEALDLVRTGEITYAVRDSQFNGFTITQGEILGLADGQVVIKGSAIKGAAIELLQHLQAQNGELLSIFYGEEITELEAAELTRKIEQEFPDLEVEVHAGGQPLYYYIFSLE